MKFSLAPSKVIWFDVNLMEAEMGQIGMSFGVL